MDDPWKLAREKYYSSGISDEIAKSLGFRVLFRDETKALGEQFSRELGLVIPYFKLDGSFLDFYRVRYLTADSWRGLQDKPIKYMQPKGRMEIYTPPLFNVTWELIAQDSDIDLFITEGELKSILSCLLGYPTIGLGGCWNWASSRESKPLLSQLEAFKWERRKVTIVFDSDVSINDNVQMAELRLCKELLSRGANPCIVRIPQVNNTKVGIDDYYMQEGIIKVNELINNAIEFNESAALWDFNQECVYIMDPGLVVRLSDGFRMNTIKFRQEHYVNRTFQEVVVNKKSTKIESRSLPDRWLKWEFRNQLNSLTYAPGKSHTYNGSLNSWKGWGCEPKKGNTDYWSKLLEVLFNNEDDRAWFEQWCAYPLQHPGVKLFTSVVMWGLHHGTGKTLIGYLLGDIYGWENAVEVRKDDISSPWSDWIENRQFIIGDEITGGESRNYADKIKGLITQERVRVNTKYIPPYFIPDCANYYFTSQHCDAFYIEDNDRRFFINEVTSPPATEEFYKEVNNWRRTGGASALFHYLLNEVDISGFNPAAPARMTLAKKAMIADSKSDAEAWAAELKLNPEYVLKKAGVLNEKAVIGCDLFSAAQLMDIYDPGAVRFNRSRLGLAGLGRVLKRSGFLQVNKGGQIWLNGGPERIWAIRNMEMWDKAKVEEIRKHYDSFWSS